MDFYEVLDDVLELLRQRGRVTYRALKVQFQLDDEQLEALREELEYAHESSVQVDDRGLQWTGDMDSTVESPPSPTTPEPTSVPANDPERVPAFYTPSYLAEKILTSKSGLEGERKIVTVLFADIKDSTELIRDLDPEDAQKLLDPAIHIMMNAVHQFEGTVNQVLGDGIMSIFGAPISHEDHSARACYAALAMQSAMQDYTDEVRRRQGLEFRIRVGLNSGEVVVRAIGNDLHMDYSAVGPTVHLAARMEQLASPGSIRLSSSTLRLVEGLVQVNDLGPIPVKGMDEPVEVYELTGASTVRRRLQAAVARGLTKFVGRDTEIEALNQALEQAGSGHGQIVSAVGEAGVGKSRLTYEFVHSHRTQAWRILESASVSYGKATPYFPVIDLLKRYTHVEDGDDARTIRAKVTGQILTLDESLQDIIPALLSLLDSLPEDSPFLQLDPPQRRQQTLDGLKRVCLRESQVQPLILVFEDLHWHDNESQALLDSLVESLPTAQLLLVVNYRPEYTHNWGSKTYYTQLRLDPLPPESSDELLDALLGGDDSFEPLKTLLIDRTEGNPFFLEESVRTLVETQVLAGAPGAYRLVQDLPSIQVPATVQAILAARIDRLSEDEKRLLQTAAVIGTEVPFTLLQAISEMTDEGLYHGLANLQAAEFLYETSLFPERVYMFKHALTHEVSYNNLLQERRRTLHARIVDSLETPGDEQATEQVERLAHHAMRGEVWDKAFTYCREAAAKAMIGQAYREAVTCFEQTLEALSHLPNTRDVMEQGIDIRVTLRDPLVALGEIERIFDYQREAEVLAETLGDSRRLGQISDSMATYFLQMQDFENALTCSERALSLAKEHQDFPLEMSATFRMGGIHRQLGNHHQVITLLTKTATSLQGDLAHERFGGPGSRFVTSCGLLVSSLAEVGDFAEGIGWAEAGEKIIEAVNDPFGASFLFRGRGALWILKGDGANGIRELERCVLLHQEAQIKIFSALSTALLGLAYAMCDQVDKAIRLLDQIRNSIPAAGGNSTRVRVALSEGYLLTGQKEVAVDLAEQAYRLSDTYGQKGFQAYALKLLGEMAMPTHSSKADPSETHYQQALILAEELGMRPLQAHCHRGLGKLYSQTGQAEQARTELSTAIEMYRDMEMTFWLPETEAALAEVEGKA